MSGYVIAKVDTTHLPIVDLHPFPGNPNEQDALTFASLLEEIAVDGFDEPLAVVPRTKMIPGEPGYVVVSGNHRLKALKQLGYTSVDCVIHHDWDLETCKIKVVKRNMMRGETDPAKFTKIVDELQGFTHDQLCDMMAFKDIDHFASLYESKSEPKIPVDEAGAQYENLIDGLSLILNQLFSEYGDTVPHGYLYFMWGKAHHLAVMASPRTKKLVNAIARSCEEQGKDINEALANILTAGMEALEGTDPTDGGEDGEFEPGK